MKRLLTLAAAFALAVLVVGILAGAPSAQTNSDGSAASSQELSEDDPLVQDARMYAAEFGVSLEEAVRRLRLQGPIGDLARNLTVEEQDTFAGLWIQHQPEYRVIARFTRDGARTIGPYVEGGPLEGLVEVLPADATLAELEAAQDRAVRIVRFLGVRAETGVDVFHNRAYLNVTDRARFVAALRRANVRLPEQVGVVEVNKLLKPSANIYAGLNLHVPNGIDCTSGFSVRNTASGKTGITTAGHCADESNNRIYRSGVLLPHVIGSQRGPYDMQWHTTPGFRDRPWARDFSNDSTPGYRRITGARGRLDQAWNSWVCHFGQGGRVAELRCGRIKDRSYGNLAGPTNPTNTYVLVVNNNADIDDRGDSGGPWYDGRIALGIHVAGDRLHKGAYMSITYFNDSGPKDFNLVVRKAR